MEIKNLNKRPSIAGNDKLNKKYLQFEKLITELKEKTLVDTLVAIINDHIENLNTIKDDDKTLRKQLRKSQYNILRSAEKEMKVVAKNHYRNMWMALGMSAFGIPMGAAFGTSTGNMAFLGVGIPIGMVIGMAVGTKMDAKAAEEGRQLAFEV